MKAGPDRKYTTEFREAAVRQVHDGRPWITLVPIVASTERVPLQINGDRPRPVPMAIGHGAAGEVMELGDGVTDLAVGDHAAPVIPPSIVLVIFGVAANVSISKLFLAGIVPGLLMGAAIAVGRWMVARKEGLAVAPKASRREGPCAKQPGP